jgi:hypothetical protein
MEMEEAEVERRPEAAADAAGRAPAEVEAMPDTHLRAGGDEPTEAQAVMDGVVGWSEMADGAQEMDSVITRATMSEAGRDRRLCSAATSKEVAARRPGATRSPRGQAAEGPPP